MTLEPLTLGERMVMIARIAAAEHIRQAASSEGVEIAQLQSLIREAKMNQAAPQLAPGTFNGSSAIKRDPKEAA